MRRGPGEIAIGLIVVAVGACGSPDEGAGRGSEDDGTVSQAPKVRLDPLLVARLPAPRKNGGSPPEQRELAAVLDRAARVTVRIEGVDAKGATKSGSGTLVSQDGEVVTTNFVVDPALEDLVAVLPSGERLPLADIQRDSERQIAKAQLGRPVNDWIDATDSARRGAWVVCAGSLGADAADHRPARTTGTILESSYAYERPGNDVLRREPKSVPNALKIDCAVRLGMEGGPVLDTAGRLVGVIVDHEVAAPVVGPASTTGSQEPSAPPVDRWKRLERTTAPGEPWTDAVVFLSGRRAYVHGVVVGSSRAVLTLARVVADGGLPIFVRLPSEAAALSAKYPCTPLAVRGELALLRCDGLEDATPILTASSPSLADEVWTHQKSVGWIGGFVTGVDREPGLVTVEPPNRYWWGGCGTGEVKYQAENSPITVGKVFAFDASVVPGAPVVGANGVPVGIAVAQVGTGVAYAVPLTEAFERFPEIE